MNTPGLRSERDESEFIFHEAVQFTNIVFILPKRKAMNNEINDLITISRFYGSDKQYVIAGGGNTSFKSDDILWVKASGHTLSNIAEDGFARMDRKKMAVIAERVYSSETKEREAQVKADMENATITKHLRASVEAPLHDIINFRFIVHLHPTVSNGLLCALNAEPEAKKILGDSFLFIPYTDPGYVLFKKVKTKIEIYREKNGVEPKVILLQNHGVFVGADSIDEIKTIYDDILGKIKDSIKNNLPKGIGVDDEHSEFLNTLREKAFGGQTINLQARLNDLTKHFSESVNHYSIISRPFIPDQIVYCKSNYIYSHCSTDEELIEDLKNSVFEFQKTYGYLPKVLVTKTRGLIAAGDSKTQCGLILDVFEDILKIAFYTDSFGGPNPLTNEQIEFIDNWEVEHYRRKVSESPVTNAD